MLHVSDARWLYGLYTCTAQNMHGYVHLDIQVHAPRVPARPLNVSVVHVTTSSVQLNVTASEMIIGLPLRGYQVQYDDVMLSFLLSEL